MLPLLNSGENDSNDTPNIDAIVGMITAIDNDHGWEAVKNADGTYTIYPINFIWFDDEEKN